MKHITKPVAKKIILDDNKYAKSTLGDRLEVSGKKQNESIFLAVERDF